MSTDAAIAGITLGSFVGFVILGSVIGSAVRMHNESPKRVVLGGMIWGALMYVFILMPMTVLALFFADAKLEAWTQILPGTILLIVLQVTRALFQLPLIGPPLLAYEIAHARSRAVRMNKHLRKLEALEKA